MPATHLVALGFPHLVPVADLLLAAVAKAHGEPANRLFPLDASLVEDAEQQSHLRQLELATCTEHEVNQ